jgi:hypothetical protein
MNASQTIIIRQGFYEDIDKAQIWMSRKLFDEVFKSDMSRVIRPRVKLSFGSNYSCYAEALQFDKIVEEKIKTRGGTVESTDSDILLTKWQRRHIGVWEIRGNPGGKDWTQIGGWFGLETSELKVVACESWCSQFCASRWIMQNHPQAIVRGAFWLGVIGIILGIMGLVDVSDWVEILLPCV